MVYLSGHELHDVEVVGAEARDKSQENEENDGVDPVVPPGWSGQRAVLGRGSQLQVDLGVAAGDDGERAAEGDGTGQEQEVRRQAGALEVEVLHAGPPPLVLAQHAVEEQGGYLQGDQGPDHVGDPADHPHASQTLQPVRMHHGQVSI